MKLDKVYVVNIYINSDDDFCVGSNAIDYNDGEIGCYSRMYLNKNEAICDLKAVLMDCMQNSKYRGNADYLKNKMNDFVHMSSAIYKYLEEIDITSQFAINESYDFGNQSYTVQFNEINFQMGVAKIDFLDYTRYLL